ncbi:MAG: type VI secretion system baseplate subunit TssG [Planctomycetota bacterium]
MAPSERKPDPPLIRRLLRDPGAFDFFRAVQVLELHLARTRGRGGVRRVGGDHSSVDTGIGFDAEPTLAFAERQIARVVAAEQGRLPRPEYELFVNFMGLVGPAGTLPRHYTETVRRRLQARDTSLRDYVAIFDDRALALFYRAWRKYRLAVEFPPQGATERDVDPITSVFLGLTGLLPLGRGARVGSEQLVEVHHAGLFSDRRRSADGLRALVRGLLRCEVRVEQFVGQWIELDPSAWTRLGGIGGGQCSQLGESAVLGTRAWSVDARIRIVAGPLSRERFRQLWPGGKAARVLSRSVASYVGPLVDFDFEWRLEPEAPTPARLGGEQQLGRDAWLGWSDAGSPDTAIFAPSSVEAPTAVESATTLAS